MQEEDRIVMKRDSIDAREVAVDISMRNETRTQLRCLIILNT